MGADSDRISDREFWVLVTIYASVVVIIVVGVVASIP